MGLDGGRVVPGPHQLAAQDLRLDLHHGVKVTQGDGGAVVTVKCRRV